MKLTRATASVLTFLKLQLGRVLKDLNAPGLARVDGADLRELRCALLELRNVRRGQFNV